MYAQWLHQFGKAQAAKFYPSISIQETWSEEISYELSFLILLLAQYWHQVDYCVPKFILTPIRPTKMSPEAFWRDNHMVLHKRSLATWTGGKQEGRPPRPWASCHPLGSVRCSWTAQGRLGSRSPLLNAPRPVHIYWENLISTENVNLQYKQHKNACLWQL